MIKYFLSLTVVFALFSGMAAEAAPVRFVPQKFPAKTAGRSSVAAPEPKYFPIQRGRIAAKKSASRNLASVRPVAAIAPQVSVPRAGQQVATMPPDVAQQLLSIYPTLD